jgi:hypothetical protein
LKIYGASTSSPSRSKDGPHRTVATNPRTRSVINRIVEAVSLIEAPIWTFRFLDVVEKFTTSTG